MLERGNHLNLSAPANLPRAPQEFSYRKLVDAPHSGASTSSAEFDSESILKKGGNMIRQATSAPDPKRIIFVFDNLDRCSEAVPLRRSA